jgi:glycogen synthase kinase 3 beta
MNSQKEPTFKIGGVLGNGTFGYVFRAVERIPGIPVAWKRSVKASRLMSRELEILEEIKDDSHIIPLLEVFYSLNADNHLVQNLIFPLYDADLEQILNGKARGLTKLDYSNTKRMIYQLVQGLAAIHAKGICHRDLKPENMLYKDGYVHISDFGCSKRLAAVNSPYSVSRYYRAPELFFGVPDYTCSIDTWSVGVILWEFAFCKLPFKGRTEGQQLIEIFKFWGPLSRGQYAVIKRSGCKWNPLFNMLKQVPQSSVFEDSVRALDVPQSERSLFIAFLRTCFSYDYRQRADGTELLKHSYFDDLRGKDVRLNIRV